MEGRSLDHQLQKKHHPNSHDTRPGKVLGRQDVVKPQKRGFAIAGLGMDIVHGEPVAITHPHTHKKILATSLHSRTKICSARPQTTMQISIGRNINHTQMMRRSYITRTPKAGIWSKNSKQCRTGKGDQGASSLANHIGTSKSTPQVGVAIEETGAFSCTRQHI